MTRIILMPPHRKIGGIFFHRCPCVSLNVCPSVCKNLTFPCYLLINLITRPIIGMKAHLINTHQQVPKLRSSAKVKAKYQGHISQNWPFLVLLSFTTLSEKRSSIYKTTMTLYDPEKKDLKILWIKRRKCW